MKRELPYYDANGQYHDPVFDRRLAREYARQNKEAGF